jgi:hypothetical protein
MSNALYDVLINLASDLISWLLIILAGLLIFGKYYLQHNRRLRQFFHLAACRRGRQGIRIEW